jgi:hypothetical protein
VFGRRVALAATDCHPLYGLTTMSGPLDRIPTADEFRQALANLDPLPDSYRRLLVEHHRAPDRDVTATELAQLVGYSNYNAANLHYGKLAGLVGDLVGVRPKMALDLLVTMEKLDEWHWYWYMRPQVAKAIEKLGWAKPAV